MVVSRLMYCSYLRRFRWMKVRAFPSRYIRKLTGSELTGDAQKGQNSAASAHVSKEVTFDL